MTTTPAPRAKPKQRERAVQQQIVHLLRSVGAIVYTLGTTRPRGDYRGTCQSPGLPDCITFVPVPTESGRRMEQLVIECKAKGGRLRPEQRDFAAHCHAAGVAHVVGGVDDVLAWLVTRGVVRLESLSHERQTRLGYAPAQSSGWESPGVEVRSSETKG